MGLYNMLHRERSNGMAFLVFAIAFGAGATSDDAPWQLWIVAAAFALLGAVVLWLEWKEATHGR